MISDMSVVRFAAHYVQRCSRQSEQRTCACKVSCCSEISCEGMAIHLLFAHAAARGLAQASADEPPVSRPQLSMRPFLLCTKYATKGTPLNHEHKEGHPNIQWSTSTPYWKRSHSSHDAEWLKGTSRCEIHRTFVQHRATERRL